jgi:hypothetical protein
MRTIVLRAEISSAAAGADRGSISCSPRRSRTGADYPGPLDVVHEWAYLPDLAAVLVRLAAARKAAAVRVFGFRPCRHRSRVHHALARAAGSKLQVKRMSWWLIHALRPIVPLCRELSEIAYLWNEPHRIDGGSSRPRSARSRAPA